MLFYTTPRCEAKKTLYNIDYVCQDIYADLTKGVFSVNNQPTICQALEIAQKIRDFDFRTSVSRDSSCPNTGPWVITIGEITWHRHLVVREVTDNGKDARLDILAPRQSEQSIDIKDVDRTITLQALLSPGTKDGIRVLLARTVFA
jgi:hypothetical protein